MNVKQFRILLQSQVENGNERQTIFRAIKQRSCYNAGCTKIDWFSPLLTFCLRVESLSFEVKNTSLTFTSIADIRFHVFESFCSLSHSLRLRIQEYTQSFPLKS